MGVLTKKRCRNIDKYYKNTELQILRSKLGQMQIQETILAVFIFIVLIVFGLVFFYRVQSASIADDFNKFQFEREAIDFITISDLPEFSCSKAGVRENCVDVIKIIAFMSLSNGKGVYKDYYFERFGYKNITIQQIYPNKINKKCSSNNINDCGVWDVYSNIPQKWQRKNVRSIPVSLYFPCVDDCNRDTYSIGLMVVEEYYA